MILRNVTVICCLLLLITISCKKENASINKTPEEILTANAWKPNELRAIVSNTQLYYKRGSTVNPNYNLDNENILFRSDNTGTYLGGDGVHYPFTWSFSNAEKTKLTWIVQFSPVTTVYWDIVTLNDNRIKYNEYYTKGNVNTQGFGDRIPK